MARAPQETVWERRGLRLNPFVLGTIAGVIILGTLVAGFAQSLFRRPAGPGPGWVRVGRVLDIRRAGIFSSTAPRAFVVAAGPDLIALSVKSPHGGEPLVFCESSGWFFSPAHGEAFDRYGTYAAGPAPRGMDRLAIKVEGGIVFIDPQRVTPGLPRGARAPDQPTGPFCGGYSYGTAALAGVEPP